MKKSKGLTEMRNEFLFLVLIVFSIAIVSSMYAGESETFDFGFEIVNCSVINNSYNLNGLNLSWNNTNATISTVVNYKPDSFIISCWVIKQKIVEEHIPSGGGGGGSCKYNKNFDWDCSEWGDCEDETQERICKYYNNCGNTYGKPNEIKSCLIEEPEPDKDEPDEPEPIDENLIRIYLLLLAIVVAIIFLWYMILKKYKKKNDMLPQSKD